MSSISSTVVWNDNLDNSAQSGVLHLRKMIPAQSVSEGDNWDGSNVKGADCWRDYAEERRRLWNREH